MYYDISLLPNSLLDLNHLLASLKGSSIGTVAIDYEFQDTVVTPPPESLGKLKLNHPELKIVSRATLIIEQTATLHQLNQISHNGYDIFAVRPKNQKIFHALCVEYDNYDMISMEIGSKMSFMLKRNPVYQALRKGKYFELQYDPILEESSRVVTMTNIINILKATSNKNIIVSSHANNMRAHRTPYDVAALLASLGLPKGEALATMKDNPQLMLKSALHRQFFKGSLKEVPQVVVKKMGKRIQKHRDALRKLQKATE